MPWFLRKRTEHRRFFMIKEAPMTLATSENYFRRLRDERGNIILPLSECPERVVLEEIAIDYAQKSYEVSVWAGAWPDREYVQSFEQVLDVIFKYITPRSSGYMLRISPTAEKKLGKVATSNLMGVVELANRIEKESYKDFMGEDDDGNLVDGHNNFLYKKSFLGKVA